MTRHFRNSYTGLPGLFDDLDLPPVPGIRPHTIIDPNPDLYFMSLGSGSSGNCTYVGDGREGFLVDAGVATDTVFDTLLHCGITPEMIKGIIITHDHGDHIRYVYSIVRKHKHIAVYCTPKAFNGIMRRHSISRRLKDYHHPIYKEFPFKLGNFEITPFEVSHDGTDNAGFFITRGKHALTIATDLGCITDRVDHYMRRATIIMIEANYDSDMLAAGPYPEYLKSRIRAYNGHLDNEITGDFLSRIYTPALRAVFLCHLSLDNNTPDAATATVRRHLSESHPSLEIGDASGSVTTRDATLQLMALPRFDASPFMRFH